MQTNKVNKQRLQVIETFKGKVQLEMIENDKPISMRILENLFLDLGYELSKSQLNEIFAKMEHGKNF